MPEKAKIIVFIRKHKLILGFLAVAAIIAGLFFYKNFFTQEDGVKYVFAKVEKGSISVSISGSGQVSASNQLEIKPKVSGDVVSVEVKAGQEVKEGQVLAKLDASSALKSVRSAQASLESAKLSLEKAKRGYREEELLNDRINLKSLEDDLEKAKADAEKNLDKAYSEANSLIQDTYNKLDEIVNRQVEGMFSGGQYPKLDFLTIDSQAEAAANSGKAAANDAVKKVKSLLYEQQSSYDKTDQNLDLLAEQLEIVRNFLNNLTDAVNSAIISIELSESALSSHKSAVASARNSINSAISNINNQKQSISSQRVSGENSIRSAEKSLEQSRNSYNLKVAGADPLDLKSLEMSVRERTNDLAEALRNSADYTIKAPFDGVIASVGVKVKEPASGSSVIATIITEQKIAEISLNEVDAAKVKVGQKAMLAFDAVDGLEVSGTVAETDFIGSVSQGVVSYKAKIAFDIQDERIKPGMSVSATIITEIRQDILIAGNSAVKTQSGQSYVEKFEEEISAKEAYSQGVEMTEVPIAQLIEIGISNDSYTEIISGLSEGDQIILKKVSAAGAAKTSAGGNSSAPSIMQSLGGSSIRTGSGMPPR